MPVKQIVVLANSIKKHARCIAGREVNDEGLGAWIRPISDVGEGELHPNHYRLGDNRDPSVLDIVEIAFRGQRHDPGQPENWLIASESRWNKLGVYDASNLLAVEEHPDDLWVESNHKIDRISESAQAQRTNQHSLTVITPENLQFRLWREHNQYSDRIQKKSRACFRYLGQDYSLSLTDPIFSQQYCNNHPNIGEDVRVVHCPFGDHCLLCISLTPPFHGYHYKVVATVLRLP